MCRDCHGYSDSADVGFKSCRALFMLAFLLFGLVPTVRSQPPTAREVTADSPPTKTEPSKTKDVVSLRDARSLLWRGHYLDAEKALASLQTEAAGTSRTALELNQIRAGLAEAQLRLGKYDQALETVGPVWTGDLATELVRARLQRLSGSYDAGMVTLKRLVTEHPLAPTPRLALAELQEYLGLREDAIETYAWFEPLVVDNADLKKDAAWLTDVAKGFYRYSVLTQENVPDRTRHVLQNMLQVAYGLVDRQYWPARLAAAELLREKYSNDETDGSVSDYKAALEINENLSEAHIGMGKIYLSRWDFESVDKVVEAVLAVNPKDVEGIRLKAAKLIIERRYPEAMEAAREALAINPRDLEALGILAGAAACRHDMTFVENVRQDFEKIAPRSSIFNRRLGDALGGIRQYAASEVAYLRAIERDPTDANVRAELGLMYMQWGDEGKARSALEGAWSLDQYNERSKNTLDLLDSLDDFDVHETDHFIIKYEQKRDPGLGEIFGHYLESIYQDLIDDYAFELQDKTIIEIFPTQPSFAVRITGKPWIHTVGACTGRVIAMASPRESTELSGPYNFASVLKHEFTHTVTLAATRNRIPHWFTEGLAVYQEDSARSFLWMRLLAEAIRRNELFTLESIDWGFIRPRRPTDRQMAYAQSEWMCEYIVERFGYDRINEMLALYREGKTQREVIEQILKISPESFSTDFAAWAERDASNWCFDLTAPEDVQQLRRLAGETPDDLGLRARLSRALLDSGDYEEAIKLAERTLADDPGHVVALKTLIATLSLYMERASAAEKEGLFERMRPHLERLEAADPNDWLAPKLRGEAYLSRQDFDGAEAPFRKLQRLCPDDPSSWRGLAAIHLHREAWDQAFPQLLELARRDENDADVRHQLGLIAWRKGRVADARFWLRQSLHVNPFSVPINQDWADLAMQQDDLPEALRSYQLLTKLKPDESAFAEKAAFAAHKSGLPEVARELARRAVALDPSSSAKALIE